eukprot:365705-Chlamydomonas_euryale.AAC.1
MGGHRLHAGGPRSAFAVSPAPPWYQHASKTCRDVPPPSSTTVAARARKGVQPTLLTLPHSPATCALSRHPSPLPCNCVFSRPPEQLSSSFSF